MIFSHRPSNIWSFLNGLETRLLNKLEKNVLTNNFIELSPEYSDR